MRAPRRVEALCKPLKTQYSGTELSCPRQPFRGGDARLLLISPTHVTGLAPLAGEALGARIAYAQADRRESPSPERAVPYPDTLSLPNRLQSQPDPRGMPRAYPIPWGWPMQSEPKPYRVLVCDDQPDVLEALRLLIKGQGWQAVAADSPQRLLETVRGSSGPFDLILTDLNYTRDTTSGQEGMDLLASLE